MAVIYSFAPENWLAAASSNFPQYIFSMAGGAYRSALSFAASEKCRSIAFKMPPFTAPLTLKVTISIAATTGNVQFKAAIEAVAPSDALNTNTSTSFDADNSSGAIAVPSTTFNTKEITITLTNNDTIAANDMATISLERDGTVGSNATGACFVYLVSFEDAS